MKTESALLVLWCGVAALVALLATTTGVAFSPEKSMSGSEWCAKMQSERPEGPFANLRDLDEHVKTQIAKILDVAGVAPTPTIHVCGVTLYTIALAARMDWGRAVVYDRSTFEGMRLAGKQTWGATAILAHEVGHVVLHLQEPLQEPLSLEDRRDRTRKWELEADEFAGFVLGRMKAPVSEAIHLFEVLGTHELKGDSTFPSREERIKSARAGWNRGRPLYARLLDWAYESAVQGKQYVEGTGRFVGALAGIVTAVFAMRVWLKKRRKRPRPRRLSQ